MWVFYSLVSVASSGHLERVVAKCCLKGNSSGIVIGMDPKGPDT